MNPNHPYSRKSSSINGLLRLLGAIFALILIIGALDKAGVSVVLDKEPQEDVVESRIYGGTEAETKPERRMSLPERPAASHDYEAATGKSRNSSEHIYSPEEWLERFASSARKQALEYGVPAGVSLAVAIEELKQGEQLNDWDDFMEKVVQPLARLKQEVPRDALRTYFKYSANSQRWAKGLGNYSRYAEQQLLDNIRQYGLSQHDDAVTELLLQDPETQRRSSEVADEVVAKRSASRNEDNAGSNRRSEASGEAVEEWEAFYEEEVGREVAKEIARRKLRSGEYIGESDMEALIEETNQETGKAMQNNIGLLGRKINPDHKDADQMLDITQPENAQARQELYQRKLREHSYVKKGQ